MAVRYSLGLKVRTIKIAANATSIANKVNKRIGLPPSDVPGCEFSAALSGAPFGVGVGVEVLVTPAVGVGVGVLVAADVLVGVGVLVAADVLVGVGVLVGADVLVGDLSLIHI